MEKADIRRAMRQVVHTSTILTDALPAPGSSVMLFWPLPDEVDTRPFIRQLHAEGVRVLLPVVEGENLLWRAYDGDQNMAEGAFGVREPLGDIVTDFSSVRRIYVPGVAFTQDGKRLGRGAGYYDRFLHQLESMCHSGELSAMPEVVGVCPHGCLLDTLPVEPHDYVMNRVLHFAFLCVAFACTFLCGACKRTVANDNPAFVQVVDTTGASDPYTYDDEDALAKEKASIQHAHRNWALRQQMTRHVHAPYINKEKGIISPYDNLFKSASAQTGWDWRLIAAQCYQESGFDPQARSGAGARGLMQIMPSTAKGLGLPMSEIHNPSANVAAAAKYIRQLSQLFADVRDAEERTHFVLAAYNGGYQHIRDAMALCRKYGGSPQRWSDVSRYVLGLQSPRYYRDPVVKHGYMIGSETANYVVSVVQRAKQYGAQVAAVSLPPGWRAFSLEEGGEASAPAAENTTVAKERSRPVNRFTRNNATVMSPEDLRATE